MRIEPITATLGARILDVDLRHDLDANAEGIRAALYEHKVVFIPGETLTELEHQRVAAIFGDIKPHPAALFMKGEHISAEVLHDAKRLPSEEKDFHNDYSFSDFVPGVGVLQALELPSKGGDTIWADMHAAFEALSPTMQEFLGTLKARHTQGHVIDIMRSRHGDAIADELAVKFDGRVHPMVVRHPVTGRKLLFVDSYVDRIEGLTERESTTLLAMLREHIGLPRFHCRYHWKTNDIAIWDELATSHQGPSDFAPERRVLRRITAGLVTPSAEMPIALVA